MSDSDASDVAHVNDVRTLAALAHPDRVRLMDVLTVHGPTTTSAIADRLEIATGSVSHHLKVLADAGLVQRAKPGSDRRLRRWERVSRSLRWTPSDFRGQPTVEAAATSAAGVRMQRGFDRARAFLETAEPPWDDAALIGHYWLHLSAEELAQLGEEIEELMQRRRNRAVPDDGTERRSVHAIALVFPAEP